MILHPWVRDINSTEQVVKLKREDRRLRPYMVNPTLLVIYLDSQETCPKYLRGSVMFVETEKVKKLTV